jgi:hypothetical protein
MHNQSEVHPLSIKILTVSLVILGLNAIFAGSAFIIAPDGELMHIPLQVLARSPFSNFLIPGILLFIFNGIWPLIMAYGIWYKPDRNIFGILNPFKKYHWSFAGSLSAGVVLIAWILIQVQWLPFEVLHGICLAWGILIISISLLRSGKLNWFRKVRINLPE